MTITNNTIMHNEGGGIQCYCSGIISGNSIINNGNERIDGGGIYLPEFRSQTVTVSNNTVSENLARAGGGIRSDGTDITLMANLIDHNSARDFGGGILFASGSARLAENVISNNVTSGSGSAIFISQGGIQISSNTIMGNSSAGSQSSTIYVERNRPAAFSGNNLFNNDDQYWFYNSFGNGSNPLEAVNNWWGTTDEEEIKLRIYDWFDDARRGIVEYRPFLTSPSETASTVP